MVAKPYLSPTMRCEIRQLVVLLAEGTADQWSLMHAPLHLPAEVILTIVSSLYPEHYE